MNNPRIIAISDIHGCFNSFVDLLNKVNYNSSYDKLILLGDYIDRGPYSYNVIRAIRGLRQKHPEGVICLRGNHEQMCIDAFGYSNRLWDRNGGRATRFNYDENGKYVSMDIPWMKTLPIHHTEGNYLFCHAGLTYPYLIDNTEDDLLWGRYWIETDDEPREKTVVFGHTPNPATMKPYRTMTGDICIDGGGVYGGTFGAFIINPDLTIEIATVSLNDKDKIT